MLHSQAVPGAIEIEWPAEGGGAVHVLLEGREDGVAGRAATVRGLLGETSTESADPPADGATYPWDVTATGDERATALKLTFALSGLAERARGGGRHRRRRAWLRRRRRRLRRARPRHTGRRGARQPSTGSAQACTRLGGSAVVVDAPAAVKAAVDVWGPVPALDLMRRVKDQFDPDHRLAPGRFVGGI